MGFRIHSASVALPLLLLLLAVVIIALTATSIMSSNTQVPQEELQKYVDDAIKDITSYLKIQHVYATYSQHKPYHLTKIAIQATPLFHQEINLSNWIIQIQTKSNLQLYTYNYTVSHINSSGVFSHPQWNQLSPQYYGILSIKDSDNSLNTHHSFSEPNDMAFFTLPVSHLSLENNDKITLFLSPGTGVEKTMTFTLPIPTQKVIQLR
jgi:archaellin